MSNYCPVWVLKCVVAQVCFDFIEQGNGLNIISKKYSSGLNELYLDTELPKIDDVATDFLKICVDFNINEKSNNLISDYLFFKFYYVNSVLKRKFNSFLNFNGSFDENSPMQLSAFQRQYSDIRGMDRMHHQVHSHSSRFDLHLRRQGRGPGRQGYHRQYQRRFRGETIPSGLQSGRCY